jgi:hypothetical protein
MRRLYDNRKPSNTNLITVGFVDSATVGRPDLMGGVSGSSSQAHLAKYVGSGPDELIY